MTRWHGQIIALVMVCISITLVGAMSASDLEDLLEQAQSAQQAKDYQRAVQLYTQAEQHSSDPGFVAYNKAVALFHLATDPKKKLSFAKKQRLLIEAERHFARCENDPTQRQARAAFGWANCLYLSSSADSSDLDNEIDRIQLALQQYERCLSLTKERSLRDSAERNRVLARARLLELQMKKRERPPTDPENPDRDNSQGSKPEEGPQDNKGKGDDHGEEKGDPGADGKTQNVDQEGKANPGGDKPQTGQAPGKPLETKDKAPRISPDQARALLAREAGLIEKARQNSRHRSPDALTKTLRDW